MVEGIKSRVDQKQTLILGESKINENIENFWGVKTKNGLVCISLSTKNSMHIYSRYF